MNETLPLHQNVIGRRLFKQSLIIALIMSVVVTVFQVWLNYHQIQGSLKTTLQQIEQGHLKAISTAVWNFSMPEINAQTAGIVNFPFVSYAEVRDTKKVLSSDGQRLTSNFQEVTIPITYFSGGVSVLIGQLYIQTDNNEVYARLLNDVIQIFLFSALNVIILTFIFLLLIDSQVTRHLFNAAQYFRNFDIKAKNPPLKLDKKITNDELDLVVSAFNTMQSNLTIANAEQVEIERKHATLLSNMPGMAYRCKNDRDWSMEVVTPGCLELTGYEPSELINNVPISYGSLIVPEDRERVWETIQAQLKERLAFEIIYHIQTKSEKIIWVWERGRGIYSPEQELIAIEGFITDITERKQQERELEVVASVSYALREAESRDQILKTVLDQITSLLSAKGGLIELVDSATGDAVVEIASGAYQELLGKRIGVKEGLNSYIRESGRPYLNNDVFHDPRNPTFSIDKNCRAAGGVPMIAHGQLLGFIWIGRNVDISEKVIGTLSSIADITANALNRVSLFQEKEQQLNQLTGLRIIDTAINSSHELSYTMNVLIKQAVNLLHVKAARISAYDANSQMLNYLAWSGLNNGTQNTHKKLERNSLAGRAVLSRDLVRVNDLGSENLSLHQVEELRKEGIKTCFAFPVIAKDEVLGVLEIFHSERLFPESDWFEFLETLAGQAAIAITDSNLLRNLKQSNFELATAYDATLAGWSNALDLRDKETEEHTKRVTEITLHLANKFGIQGEEIRNIWRGARLHDIGKMGVPDEILQKKGKLTPEEWLVMKEHPVNAYKLLYPIIYLRQALDIPYCHHEKWDGTGYPRGLKGEEIPLSARIFAVADVWDAMTQDRVYRKALSQDEATQYIRENSGKHFDPKVVDFFLQFLLEQNSSSGTYSISSNFNFDSPA